MAERTTSGRLPALLLLPAAALVAGALLLMRMRMQPPTVPDYALASAPPRELHDGDTLTLDLAPVSSMTGAVAARGFLLRGDAVRPWEAPFTAEPSGAVHIEGKVSEMFADVPPGPWTLTVAVGRPETLPTTPRALLLARDAPVDKAAFRLVTVPVVLATGAATAR